MASNPNTMTFQTVFQAEYQMSHFKEPVYQILADTRLEASLTKGQTVARSYASDVAVNDMGGDGGYSTQAITDTQETLVVNKEKEASIYIKRLDELQAHLPVKQKYGRKLAQALVNQIDADVLLAAYQGAGTALDDGNFAGTSGNGFQASSQNIANVFTTAMQKLRLKNVVYNSRIQSGAQLEVPEGAPIAIVSPEILSYIELYLGGKDTLLGDQISRNGFSGYFMGFNLLVSNALPWTGTLQFGTQPTNGDTVVINGVTFTFVTGTPTNAGDVKSETDGPTSLTNLYNALIAPTTSISGKSVAVTAANGRLLKNFTFTNNTTNLGVVAAGWGTVVVSETLTAPADIWTTTKQQLKLLFALSKSVALVVQKTPSLEENFVSAKIGRDYIAWTVYGIKVFVDQAPQIVSLAIDSSTFTAAATSAK